jgi:glycerophosphoryl diester phosphodiesterase
MRAARPGTLTTMEATQPWAEGAGRRERALTVAHRAGNDLARMAEAERRGVDVVEADVHLFHGRLEVRHLKSVGPLPFLWDRWEVAPPWRRPLGLDAVLESADPRTHLMLDLKGFSRRIAVALEAYLGAAAPSRSLTLCARHWPLLAPFRDSGHRVVLSAGNRAQLRALVRRGGGVDGVSVHAALLGSAVVARLRETTDLVMSWPVNTSERMSRLAAWGVNAFISDEWAALAAGGREAAAA